MDFADVSVTVRCAVFQNGAHHLVHTAIELRVQAKSGEEAWRDVWVAKDLVKGENVINMIGP
jgi:hypothetical protein